MENWKPIEGYEGIYEVSDQGRVKNIKYNRFMTAVKVTHGYLAYNLSKQGKTHSLLAHRLVAKAFIPNPDNKPQVNHIDGVKSHNFVTNLEWTTSSENLWHAVKTGLWHAAAKNLGPESKPNYTSYLWRSKLKQIREEKGLTQEALADASTVRLDTIKNLESNGQYFRSAGVTIAYKLSWTLGVRIEDLFECDIGEVIRIEKAWHKK